MRIAVGLAQQRSAHRAIYQLFLYILTLLAFNRIDSSDDEGLANSAGESSDDWEEDESEAENGDEKMDASDADE